MAIKITREEYQKKFGTIPQIGQTPTKVQQTSTPTGEKGLKGFSVGVGKGVLSTVQGLGQLGLRGAELISGKSKGSLGSQETFFEDKNALKAQGTAEKIGKFGEQVAEFAIPGSKVAKATQGMSFIPRIASRAATSGAIATAQSGEIGRDTAIAAGTEAALPVVGKIISPATKFIGTLLKGTGSALSGAPAEAIESILKDGKVALNTAKEIRSSGSAKVLEQNAKTVINGISKIRQEARQAYGQGLEQLSKTDIDPTKFRSATQPILEKFGSVIENGKRTLKNIEFDDPKNIARANDLISKLSKVELNGSSIRKLADDIENAKYKVATSDERLAYNAFINKLSKGLKDAVSSSTPKLDEINQAFSSDMELAQATEKILGKVKYKNLGEINDAAKKLESLFTEKGLDPQTVDKFLERIGVSSNAFKSGEAMRQLSEKSFTANTMGTSPFEIVRAFTASAVSPKMVGKIAAYTGLAENVVKEMSTKLSPAARGALIELLTGNK